MRIQRNRDLPQYNPIEGGTEAVPSKRLRKERARTTNYFWTSGKTEYF